MQDLIETEVDAEIDAIINENTINSKENMNLVKSELRDIKAYISDIQEDVSSLKKELEIKDKTYGKEITSINNDLEQSKVKLNKNKKKLVAYRTTSLVFIGTIIILFLKVFNVF